MEFAYTGNIQISTQEIAIELFTIADYLLLPSLKSLTKSSRFLLGSIELTVSNCIATHYFAEKQLESTCFENRIIHSCKFRPRRQNGSVCELVKGVC